MLAGQSHTPHCARATMIRGGVPHPSAPNTAFVTGRLQEEEVGGHDVVTTDIATPESQLPCVMDVHPPPVYVGSPYATSSIDASHPRGHVSARLLLG